MNRIVGFDRQLRLDWLNTTLGFVQSGLTPDEARQRLGGALAGTIAGGESRRKTIIVLIRIWGNIPADQWHLREQAVELAGQICTDELLWLHWGMSLLAYPFFRDVASVVGQLGNLQGAFTHAQVQRRMIESWGQRTTLQRAARRLLRTYVDWNVLEETGARGSYVAAPPHRTGNRDLALWFFECALRAHEAEQVPLRELERLAYAFPFDLASHLAEVRRSDRFEVLRQGHDLEMVTPAWLGTS